MAIPNPNPNIADGIKSDNKTYSSNKIESLIKTATELPIPEAGDAGKVLTVNSDSDGYELDNVGGIPSIAAGDAGKVITVNAGASAYELATPVAPESIIDDTAAAADSVYSSSKVNTLLSGKQDALNVTMESGSYEAGLMENDSALSIITYGKVLVISGYFKALAEIPANTSIASLNKTLKDQLFYMGFITGVNVYGFRIDNSGVITNRQVIPTSGYVNFSAVAVLA